MYCGYYRKRPYRCLGLGPIGGYQGMFAPDWMLEKALKAAARCQPFNCNCPCSRCCKRCRRARCGRC